MTPTTRPAPEPDIDAELPLTETTFLVLVALAGGPRHGYAILKQVEALSEGRLRPSTGTLYGALRRLLAARWIERRRSIDPADGRGQKYYALTGLGARIVEAERKRLARLARVGLSWPAASRA